MSESLLVHATTVSLNGLAVVLRGGSGAGKSDLALQLLESAGSGLSDQTITALLVSDDQTRLQKRGAKIYASSPHQIRGLLEIRGQGIVKVSSTQEAEVVLVVDLTDSKNINRMPEPADLRTEVLGLTLPRIAIDASKPSAAARVRVAFAWRDSLVQAPLAIESPTA